MRINICASCEWVFTGSDELTGCPKCGFGYYNAVWALRGIIPALWNLLFQSAYKRATKFHRFWNSHNSIDSPRAKFRGEDYTEFEPYESNGLFSDEDIPF